MSGARHTPGPWSCREAPYGWDIFNNELAKWVAYGTKTVEDGSQPVYPTRAESAANADLIAAAPDLLETSETLLRMLEAAYRELGMWSDDNKRVVAAKAAIARAKGGAS